jgi:hypothetical protein
MTFNSFGPFFRAKPLSLVKAVDSRYRKGETAMKSIVRNFALSAAAASTGNQRSFRFKKAHLLLALGLIAPLQGFAASEAPYCIAVNGGFGNGGTTFVARNFSLPTASKCSPWTGYTKTASTVILTTSGTSCLSSDNTALTVSVSSADPSYVGAGTLVSDYIQLSRPDATQPFTGTDAGYFAGTAEPVSCTSDLLSLPSYHD